MNTATLFFFNSILFLLLTFSSATSQTECPDITFDSDATVGAGCYKFDFTHGCPSGSAMGHIILEIISPSGVHFESASVSGSASADGWTAITSPTSITYTGGGSSFYAVGDHAETFHFCLAGHPSDVTILWKTYKGLRDKVLCVDSAGVEYDENEPCASVCFNPADTAMVNLPSSSVYVNANPGFTWECWFKLNSAITDSSVGYNQSLISIDRNCPTPGRDIFIGFGSTYEPMGGGTPKDEITFWVDTHTPSSPPLHWKPAGGFSPGVWYFVAGGVDYTSRSFGLAVGKRNPATNSCEIIFDTIRTYPNEPIGGPFKPSIGSWGNIPRDSIYKNTFFNGCIDEVRFWDVPRSRDEVQGDMCNCLYNASDLPSHLAAYYPILYSDGVPTPLNPLNSISELVLGLDGEVRRANLATQPNSAPLGCCYEVSCDSLSVSYLAFDSQTDSADCCYSFDITSTIPFSNINRVTFRPVQPGVSILTSSASAPAGWGATLPSSPTTDSIGWMVPNPSTGLNAGTYSSFDLCFINNSGSSYITVEILYSDGSVSNIGDVICSEQIRVECESQNKCDSLIADFSYVEPSIDDPADCCYSSTITALSDFSNIEVVSFTPLESGVDIVSSSAPAGWGTYSPMTPNSVSWMVPSPPGLSAGTYSSFDFCFTNSSGTNPFPLQVAYTDANYGEICLDTIMIRCQPSDDCDSLSVDYKSFEPPTDSADCCYSFAITAGMTYPTVEVVSFTPLAGGVSIHTPSASAPAGWSAMTPPMTPNSVSWIVPSPPGLGAGTHSAFDLCFINSSATNPFPLQIAYTDANYGEICLDTIMIKCEPDSVPCPEEDTTVYELCCKESRFTNPSAIQRIDCQITGGTGTIRMLFAGCGHSSSFTATNGGMWDFSPFPTATRLTATLCAQPSAPGGWIDMIWTVYVPGDTCYYQQSFHCPDTTTQVIDFDKGKESVNFALLRGAPNPAENKMTIFYLVDKSQYVSIELFNEAGEKVKTLKNEIVSGGINELRINAGFLSSGNYYVVMKSKDGKVSSLPIVIVK